MLLKVFGQMYGIARSLSIRLALFYIYVWINCIDFFFDNWFKIRKWSFVSILTLNFRKSKLYSIILVRLSR